MAFYICSADNYDEGYAAGQTAGYNSGYSAGRTQGRNDVISNPSAYGVASRSGVQYMGNLSIATNQTITITATNLKAITGFCYSNPGGYGGYFGVVYLVGHGFVLKNMPAYITVSISGNRITLTAQATFNMDAFYAFGVY